MPYTNIFGLALAWSLNYFDICMVNEVTISYNYVYWYLYGQWSHN